MPKQVNKPSPSATPIFSGPYGGQPNASGVNVVRPAPTHTPMSHSPKKAKGGRKGSK